MIIGTWNLEVYLSRHTARGIAMAAEIDRHAADVWFLTELHSDWKVEGHAICFAPARAGAHESRRFTAIASSWDTEPIVAPDNPVEGWMCLARLTNPLTSETCIAASGVLPWRGITPYWRNHLSREITFSEAFRHVLDYMVRRIEAERRNDEAVIWGGDFNQALEGRDYVGTKQGRADLQRALDGLGIVAATSRLPALIPTHPAIDHIAIPAGWTLQDEPVVHRPTRNGRPLSDHALYLLDTCE